MIGREGQALPWRQRANSKSSTSMRTVQLPGKQSTGVRTVYIRDLWFLRPPRAARRLERPVSPRDVHHHVQAAFNLLDDRGKAESSTRPHRESREPMDRLVGAARMNRRKRSSVPGVHCIEQGPGFRSANFTDQDSVGTVPENRPQKIIECNGTLVCIGLGLGGYDVRFADMQLGGILDDQDSFVLGNEIQPGHLRSLSCRFRCRRQ